MPSSRSRGTKANHGNARADVAVSKQGVSFYFAVGEAF
jgi:hypothetical protein